jgi:glycosyltransferase involved in cell wall biosynthesis
MSDNLYKRKVAFSVTNCICHDQRVLKIATMVESLGCHVVIIGRHLGECCNSDLVPFRTRRFRMIFSKGFLFYKFFNIRLFIYLLFHRYDLLVANDLDTLLPNFLISKLKSLTLVYDSHEYFTGVPELQDRHFVRGVWKTIEKSIFPHLKNVMTVSDSIAVQYEEEYGIRPLTVRNCSRNTSAILPFTREELGVNPKNLLLILQGTGINRDRGGVELIDALKNIDNVFLLIVGSGDLVGVLTEMVFEAGLSRRIKFIPKCPWNELMRYTKSCDAGLSLDKNSNLNYGFSLPNKLFDYISAGLPVIASDLPEIRYVVSEYGCGILIPEVNPSEISKAIIKLRDDKKLLMELKQNSIAASRLISWERESVIVKNLYNSILFRP